MKNTNWIAVAVKLPDLNKRVLVCDYCIDGRPELDNIYITYLTKDCNTQQIKWQSGFVPNSNSEFWQYIENPPSKIEIQRQVTINEQEFMKIQRQTVRYPLG